ncbi:class I SAM-dependent methyltransferase [Pelagerythrobacter marinus]|uniref:class I SAM-dependent methyltransferase n=1 Tax=Pelagerythrobacter marinus TaxID=538382 RepID=UPI00203743F0|nr:methyltransferase [Pelagerythrobacter marinus]USA39508.1 methyltransferase [Pelagerythrobacter marinus]WPZ06352.1 methyltransferase [Pelagerythrobacter marinus]
MRFLLAAAVPFAAVSLAAMAAPAQAQEHGGAEGADHRAAIEAALAHPGRADDRARDAHRHPAETIAFFRIAPDMKVGEYAPGGGWYSRVLGHYLGQEGELVGLYFTPDAGPFDAERQAGIRQGAAGFAGKVAEWTGRPEANFAGMTLDAATDADRGTFDRVLVVRMLHNLMRWNSADSELKAMRDLLKPGGMLGIVQHRAKADAPADYADGSKGYLRQEDVVGFVEALGFELVAASEVNANPADSADHARGVWEMPPTLATERAELEGLGESDRMTLLFRKR